MIPLGYHVRVHLKEARLIASSPEERRLLAQVVLDLGRDAGLIAFDLPGDHLHCQNLCDRQTAGAFAHRIGSSLKQRLGHSVGFEQYEPKPIADLRHMRSLLGYILRQPERHAVDADPFREASNLPDLLGLRLTGAHTIPRLRQCLPQLRRSDLLAYLGVPNIEPTNGPYEAVVPAALRATGLVSLHGKSRRALEARRAVAAVLHGRASRRQIGQLLGASRAAMGRIRTAPPAPILVQAIRLQLGLHVQLGPRASLSRCF